MSEVPPLGVSNPPTNEYLSHTQDLPALIDEGGCKKTNGEVKEENSTEKLKEESKASSHKPIELCSLYPSKDDYYKCSKIISYYQYHSNNNNSNSSNSSDNDSDISNNNNNDKLVTQTSKDSISNVASNTTTPPKSKPQKPDQSKTKAKAKTSMSTAAAQNKHAKVKRSRTGIYDNGGYDNDRNNDNDDECINETKEDDDNDPADEDFRSSSRPKKGSRKVMTRSTSGRSRSIRSKRSTENNNEDDKRVFQLTPPTDGITLNDKEITEIVRSVHTSIGEGRYGTVYKFASTMGEMALKIWHKQTRVSDNDITQLINEASITQQCRSECVVQFVGYYLVPPAICIITRHCSCGTLARYYDRNGAAALPEARGLMCDLATALAHVHGLGFVHRDVKPDNCFLERDSSRLRLRLGDFGHAVEAAAADPSVRGTDGWAAPELYANKKATAKSDVYSMGLVAFFLLNGRAPHSNDRINAYLKGDSDPAWARLIVECTKHAPEKRPDSPRIKLLVGALPQLKQFPSAKYRFRLEDLGDSNTSCHQQLTQQKPKNPPSAATTVSHPKSRVMLIRKMQKTYIAQVRPFKNKEHAPQDPPPHKIMKD